MNNTNPTIQKVLEGIKDCYKESPEIKEVLDLWKISKKEYDSLLEAVGRKGSESITTSTINTSFNGNYSGTTFGEI